MAKEFRFYAIREANADIQATSDAINALLVSAKVETISVNGKPLPATSDEVPNTLKVAAFAATVKVGASDAQLSTALANNTILADQAKALETRAVTAEASLSATQAENRDLQQQLQTAQANIATLTAATAELTNLRKAANDEAARLTGEKNALNTELSKRCLAVDCLADLRGADGNLIASTASKEDRQMAAERIPAADKLNALCGAVNSAIARAGVAASQIPAGGLTQTGTAPPKMSREAFLKLPPAKQTEFFKACGKITD